jgi:hypothetical protein
MAVRSDKNEYRGVNAHLHSYFQNRGGWEGFHHKHVGDIGEVISAALPDGYIVDTERSIQIRETLPENGERVVHIKPDVVVFHESDPSQRTFAPEPGSATPTLTQPTIETVEIDEDDYYPGLVVYRVGTGEEDLGRPIMRLELLSPKNKRGYGLRQYREKRAETLRAGLSLVEIDYLHETPSPIQSLPRYPGEESSFAYNITVSDPRPSLLEGLTATYGFSVDEPIPKITLALEDDDKCLVDFDDAYHLTYSRINAYRQRVDYEKLPENFESYSEADQDRIRARMTDVLSRLSR